MIEIDPSTGAATTIGSIGFGNVTGLTHENEVLYGIATSINQLISIDPTTGAGTLISSLDSVIRGIAYGDGILYGSNYNSNELYSIDATTGNTTLIGSFNVGNSVGMYDLTYGDGVLYATDIANGALYTLDKTTGAANYVGQFGSAGRAYGLTFQEGVLYGSNSQLANATGDLIAINTQTGTSTTVGAFTFPNVQGLTAIPTVIPEPSIAALSLGILALATVGFYRSLRKKTRG